MKDSRIRFPGRVKLRLRFLRRSFKYLFGMSPRQCPICGFEGRFLPESWPPVMDAICPGCGSSPRHRLFQLLQDRQGVITSACEVLHFAPERSVARTVRKAAPARYTTADLYRGTVDLKLDIEKIDLPDASFDRVICSHVLEHVDDRKAIAELHRILRPGGILLAMVPLVEGWDHTYEDPAVTSKRDRWHRYGGWTHVRYYGRDFRERLGEAGFSVGEFTAVEPDVDRHGLIRGEKVFLARKA